MLPSYSLFLLFSCETGWVHSRPPSASSMKFATVFGASFSKSTVTIWPSLVLNTAYVPGLRDIMNSFCFERRPATPADRWLCEWWQRKPSIRDTGQIIEDNYGCG